MDASKVSILIIDNEREFSFFVKATLELRGNYDIRTIPDGYNGLILAAKERPDIIMLDILMPSMNGFQILGKLKAMRETRDIPVIISSAIFDQESIDEAKRLGAAAYLVKPYAIKELIDAIEGASSAGGPDDDAL